VNLSVIIPCFNGACTIGAQLEALAKQRWHEPWEVIVADNGSTDESVAIVERYKSSVPNLRVVDASARRGQPYALNVGAQAARGDALAFCDADDEVALGWVAAMSRALSEYDFVASRIDVEKLNAPWIVEVSRNHVQRTELQKASYPPYLPHAGGGTLGVKRSLHEAIGGFDESLPYLHDTDYCFRLQMKGVRLQFIPDAVVNIRCRDKPGAFFYQACHYAEYRVLVYKKYRSSNKSDLWRWKVYLDGWRKLLLSFARLRSEISRPLPVTKIRAALWLWKLGCQIGSLKGSIKYRVPPPIDD
jgi:glycosyltransferase involved in cell wall biosynthesis